MRATEEVCNERVRARRERDSSKPHSYVSTTGRKANGEFAAGTVTYYVCERVRCPFCSGRTYVYVDGRGGIVLVKANGTSFRPFSRGDRETPRRRRPETMPIAAPRGPTHWPPYLTTTFTLTLRRRATTPETPSRNQPLPNPGRRTELQKSTANHRNPVPDWGLGCYAPWRSHNHSHFIAYCRQTCYSGLRCPV